MLEKEIESKMRAKIKKHGGKFIKFTSPSYAGVPDRIVIKNPGRVIFVELKKDGEAPTPRQKYVHKVLRDMGCEVRVVIGLSEAMRFIEEVFPC